MQYSVEIQTSHLTIILLSMSFRITLCVPFKEFPAQSRKYKVILTIASQTLSQLALDFTEQYMFTLLGSFRNKMIFGDVTPYDAKIFSDMFGEKEEFKEAESEQGISPMQENPVSRLGSTYQKNERSCYVTRRYHGTRGIHLCRSYRTR